MTNEQLRQLVGWPEGRPIRGPRFSKTLPVTAALPQSVQEAKDGDEPPPPPIMHGWAADDRGATVRVGDDQHHVQAYATGTAALEGKSVNVGLGDPTGDYLLLRVIPLVAMGSRPPAGEADFGHLDAVRNELKLPEGGPITLVCTLRD